MSSEKTTPINFHSGRQRLTRLTIAAVNAATLVGSILFVTWILGKIIGALHALVFSLVLTGAPEPLPRDFPMQENATRESVALYNISPHDWRQEGSPLTGRFYPSSQQQEE